MDTFSKIYGPLVSLRKLIFSLEEMTDHLSDIVEHNSNGVAVFQKELDEVKRDIKIIKAIFKRLQKGLNKGHFKKYIAEHKDLKKHCYDLNEKCDRIFDQI